MKTQLLRFLELALLTVAVCLICGLASAQHRQNIEVRSLEVEALPRSMAQVRGWQQLELGCLFAGWTDTQTTPDPQAAAIHFERGYQTARSEQAQVLCASGLAYLAHLQGDRDLLQQQYSRLRLLDDELTLEHRKFIALLQANRPGTSSSALAEPPRWLKVGRPRY